jgi:hypothetical protein
VIWLDTDRLWSQGEWGVTMKPGAVVNRNSSDDDNF